MLAGSEGASALAKVRGTVLLAAAGVALIVPGVALPARATHLDYLETATARTLPGQGILGEYKLEFGVGSGTPVTHELGFLYGLTDELMVLAAVGLDGTGYVLPAYREFELGLTYGAGFRLLGIKPAARLEYAGDHLAGTAILSFDQEVRPLFGSAPEDLNLAANLVAIRHLTSATTALEYRLGVNYPILDPPPEDHGHAASDVRRHARGHSSLKVGLEARGAFEPGAGQYVIPEFHVSPGSSIKIGAGLGIKLAGEGDPAYVKTSLQIGF